MDTKLRHVWLPYLSRNRRSLNPFGLLLLALWLIFVWALADILLYQPVANAIW